MIGGVEPACQAGEDRLLGGRLRLRQPARGYRVAVDPVLLAAAVPARDGQRVLDLGCGVGAASLCLLARVPGLRVTGLELAAPLVSLARDNATLNGLGGRFEPLQGDLLAPPAALAADSFDHVVCNPPYLPRDAARPPADPLQAAASVEGEAALVDWVAAAFRWARPRALVTFIHRADRMGALIAAFEARAGALVLAPLWPRRGEPARRVILQGRKAVRSPARIAPGLVIHQPDGGYTVEAAAILDGAPLEL